MHGIQLTKHVIRNGWMEYQLRLEYEKLREGALAIDGEGGDPATALKWFSYYGRKLQQVARIRTRLAAE